MEPLDPLEELMHGIDRQIRARQREEARQADLDRAFLKRTIAQQHREAEASARASKRAEFLRLRQAFDAERFRWLAGHLDWLAIRPYAAWDIETLRDKIDSAMRQDP